MSRITKIYLIVLSFILITGCFEYRVDATFSEDKCSIYQKIIIDKNTFNINAEDIKKDIKDESMIIEETDDLIILKKHIEIISDDYNTNGITVSKMAGGYTVIFNPYKMSKQDSPMENISLNNNFIFAVNIKDGEVISHNADFEKGDTIYFNMPYDSQKTASLPELQIRTSKMNIKSYVIAFAAIIILMLAIIILKSRDSK